MNPTGNGESSLFSFQLPREIRAALGFVLALPVLVALGCEATEPQPVTRIEPVAPQTAPAKPAAPQVDECLFTAEELKQLSVELSIERQAFGGTLRYNIYNGSKRWIKSTIVEIAVKNKDGEPVLSQLYRLDSTDVRPLSASGPWPVILGFTLQEGQTWTWRLVSVWGEKP